MNLASLSVCETAWHPPTYSSLRSDSASFSRAGSAELTGTQVALAAIPRGAAENCSRLHALPTSQPQGCCGWRCFTRPKLAAQQNPCSELCSPEQPCQCQRPLLGSSKQPLQLLFDLIMLPELESQRTLVLSGFPLVLKENFLFVPESLFLFLCLDKLVGRTFAWAKINFAGGRQSPCC